ncbi:hypothetical protein QQ045_030194 [Rhodiola kirilowii]
MKTLAAFVSIACIAAAALLHPSEAEIVDCSSIYFTVPDCLDFVRYGSTLQKPRDACCTGLASIMMASAECLCVGFGSIARFGVDFNFTKALSIPSVCNLPAPPSNCGTHAPQTASAPAPGPASSPGSAPQVGGPLPSIYPGSPALPPEKSGSSTITTVSLATAVFGLLVASFVRN